MSGLLAHYGEDGLIVAIGPLAVDGLMVMAAGALVATDRPAFPSRQSRTVLPSSGTVRREHQDEQDDAATIAPPATYPRPALSADLLDRARAIAATAHQDDTGGRPITRDALRTALGVSNGLASDLLGAIRQDGPHLVPIPSPPVLTGPVNGHRPS